MRKLSLFLVFIAGVILPIVTHLSLWGFGFMAGVGLVGFLKELD